MKAVCPLCDSESVKLRFGAVASCRKCGFIFATVDEFDARKTYNQEYFSGKVYRDYVREGPAREKIFTEKLKLVAQYLPAHGRVLDVGCATGIFLKVIRDMGYEAYGVEVSDYAARHAREAMNLEVFNGELSEAHFPSEFFQLVTMWDVLEHLPDFLNVLKECRRVLAKDGILIIETLNAGSLSARLLGRWWPLYAPPYHVSYFTRDSLATALERSGFKVLQVTPVQMYVRTPGGFRAVRYFRHACLRRSLGRFLDEVVLAVSSRMN